MNLDGETAQEVIKKFGLAPLAGEGGYFSVIQYEPAGNSIYFLLKEGDFSSWHRLQERETWVLLAGDPVDIHIYSEIRDSTYSKHCLDRSQGNFVHSVPPDEWMSAQTQGKWSLILCYLAPAFSSMQLATFEQVRTWISLNPEIPELVHE